MKTEYAKQLNCYPTIFLSFADAKGSIKNITKFIKIQIAKAYTRYMHVLDDVNIFEKAQLEAIIQGLNDLESGSLDSIEDAISFLMSKCHQYYGKKVMLFCDEQAKARLWCDTPFIEAHTGGFYEELRESLAAILHTSLKTSDDLQYAMLTGIQRVAKENAPRAGFSLFSDLNNLLVCTVNDHRYAEYFGFTEEEVKKALQAYDLPFTEEIKQMYDGYNMGGVDIYNPWSIINYLDHKKLMPYWVNTSSNKMMRQAMQNYDVSFKEGYDELIRTGTVTALVNFETSFYELQETNSLWGLFAPQAGNALMQDI